MRPLRTPVLLLGIAFAVACARDIPTIPGTAPAAETAALSFQSAANCQNVRGAIEGNANVPDGDIWEGLGTISATILAFDPKGAKGQGAIYLVTLHQIATPDGMILTSDEGMLAPIDPPLYRLNHRWTITGGTSGYEGASGFLHPHATVNLATGDIEGFSHGRICTQVLLASGYRPRLEHFLEASECFDAEGTPLPSALGKRTDRLFLCGFHVAPTGMLREIGREARRIASGIAAEVRA